MPAPKHEGGLIQGPEGPNPNERQQLVKDITEHSLGILPSLIYGDTIKVALPYAILFGGLKTALLLEVSDLPAQIEHVHKIMTFQRRTITFETPPPQALPAREFLAVIDARIAEELEYAKKFDYGIETDNIPRLWKNASTDFKRINNNLNPDNPALQRLLRRS